MGRKAIDLTGQQFGNWTVMYPAKSKGKHAYWHCKCNCEAGTEKDIRGRSLRDGQSLSCGCNSYQISKNLIGKKFFKLTPLQYDMKKHKWLCQCDCGNTTYVPTSAIGYTKSCGCANKDAQDRMRENLIGKKFNLLTVINFNEQTKKWQCVCDCGSNIIKEATGSHLRSGSVASCGCLSSKGENTITQLLIDNNILFIKQQKFNTCRFPDTGHLAKFDFYLPSLNYLIEYDGEQHFKYTAGWNSKEDFEKTKIHDAYKNQWCKENNIPLIRIPYTHLKDLCIKDLQLETTTFLIN